MSRMLKQVAKAKTGILSEYAKTELIPHDVLMAVNAGTYGSHDFGLSGTKWPVVQKG